MPTTPINISAFEKELVHYDRTLSNYIVSGLKNGFDLGYTGPDLSVFWRNLKSAYVHPDRVNAYLMNEISLGRIMGPFDNPPFRIFRCSPLGIVPKKIPGKFRTILNLSAPHGLSVNDFISKEDYSLTYISVDKAIDMILSLGKGCYLTKVDIKDAFRILPIRQSQWHLLGIYWDGKYYYDTRLPMGSRSSPHIFDRVSSAVEWICQHNYLLQFLCHLLDDFLAAEDPSDKGNARSTLLYVFDILGIPVAPDKVEGPSTLMEFLGITLDTVEFVASLSAAKIQSLKSKIISTLSLKKISKRDLLSLIGSLSFACRVVVPGRSFLSRMISLSCSVRKLNFKIYIRKQVKEDLRIWLVFLQNWNGRNFFLEKTFTSSFDLDLSTDASIVAMVVSSAVHGLQNFGVVSKLNGPCHVRSFFLSWSQLPYGASSGAVSAW